MFDLIASQFSLGLSISSAAMGAHGYVNSFRLNKILEASQDVHKSAQEIQEIMLQRLNRMEGEFASIQETLEHIKDQLFISNQRFVISDQVARMTRPAHNILMNSRMKLAGPNIISDDFTKIPEGFAAEFFEQPGKYLEGIKDVNQGNWDVNLVENTELQPCHFIDPSSQVGKLGFISRTDMQQYMNVDVHPAGILQGEDEKPLLLILDPSLQLQDSARLTAQNKLLQWGTPNEAV